MKLYEKFIFMLILSLMYCIGLIPKKTTIYLGKKLGLIWYKLDKRHRKIASENLRLAFPEKSEKEIEELVLKNFQHWGLMFFETARSLHIDRRNVYQYTAMEGLGHMGRAYAKKRGVIFISSHLGSWEIFPACTEKQRIETNIIYRTMDFKPLDAYFNYSRTRLGAKAIPVKNSLKKIYEQLAKGESVFLLIDQNASIRNGTFINFMGREACAFQGAAIIALKAKVPVLPLVSVREGDKLKTIFGPHIALVETGDYEYDIRINTQRYNDAIEKLIRRYPEQWLWAHNRWKTQRKSEIETVKE